MVSPSRHYLEIWTGAVDALASSRARPSACPTPDQYIIVAAEVLVPIGTRPSTAPELVTLITYEYSFIFS